MEITWSNRIKELQVLGWTLNEIGIAIELSPQALSDIKQGRTAAPVGMAAVRLHSLHRKGKPPRRYRVRRAA